jgi:hypothetical protein
MSCREQLIRAEARELARHRSAGGSVEYVKNRGAMLDKKYWPGAKDQVREMMKTIKQEDEE